MNNRRSSSEAGSFRSRFPENTVVHVIIIVAVCILCYSNTFQSPFQFDDSANINEKPFVRDIGMFFDPARFSGDSVFIMRPVTYFTLAVNYLLHGKDVFGYHLVNLVIHMLNGVLVYFLVLLTFRTPFFTASRVSFPPVGNLVSSLREESLRPSEEKSEERLRTSRSDIQGLIPLFAALLFVSHPIQTQAVTYIIQRTASLATLFFLLSFVMYVKWRLERSREPEVGSQKSSCLSWLFYAASVLSAVLAMKTKEIAFTLPLVIALYEFLFFSGPVRKRIIYLLPLLLAMLIIPFSLISIGKPTGEIIGDVSEATKLHTDMSRGDYLFTQFRVIVTYLRLLFFPVKQNLDYDYPLYHSFFDPHVFLSFLFLLAIFGVGVYLVYRSRGGREGLLRLISFGIFWFFITLSVESSVIPIVDLIFEHRLYLPSIGFFIAVTAVLFNIGSAPPLKIRGGRESYEPGGGEGRFSEKEVWNRPARIAVGAFVVIIVILSGATFTRNNVWQSQSGFWEDVVKKSPKKSRPHDNLGSAYADNGRYEEALLEFEAAVRLDRYNHHAHYNLGNAYGRQGRFEEAVRELQTVIQLAPDDVDAYNNLGLLFKDKGHPMDALKMFRLALVQDPDFDKAHNNLGMIYLSQSLVDEAFQEFRIAVELNPAFAEAHYNLGNAYASKGNLDIAIRELQEAARLKPGNAMLRYGLGLAYGKRGLLDQAISEFGAAIELQPGYKEAIENLEIALALKAKQ